MKLAVIGVGLIGGSVGMAARRRLGAEVVGCDPDAASLQTAIERGAIDAGVPTLQELPEADAVVVAVPVPALVDTVRAACAHLPQAVVTDGGSTKRSLVDAVDAPGFIGGHPLAGAEAGGIRHAREDLFEGATWYLTPGPASEGVRYERVHRLVAGLGATPTAIGHADHDRIMAAVSHLPHVVANVLVAQATDALDAEHVPATGPSFRDATRVAGANPSLWSGIYAANHQALATEIDKAIGRLGAVRDALRAGDDLGPWQQEALEQRQALLEVGLTGGERAELRVAVPNRPGVIADLALTLGRAGINISDMSLSPSPDNTSGEVALWVAAAEADRAADLIGGLDLHVTR